MKIVIFGGTTEGRRLSQLLAAEGAQVIVSVVSEYGAEEQGVSDGISIEEGPKDIPAMKSLIRGTDLVVDATHPYAVLATSHILRAAEEERIPRIRLAREGGGLNELPSEGLQLRLADSVTEAANLAAGAGRVLLTTGSKDLLTFAQILDPQKIFPRVLPLGSSILACEQAGIPHRNIIAIQGPFSEELNCAVIREFDIDIMISKESGRAGGFEEKMRACRSCGIGAIVIRRPEDDGLSFDEVLAICREKLK